jgi:16S rRNA G527 N7-methylase RsmG
MKDSLKDYLFEASNRGFIGENETNKALEISKAFSDIVSGGVYTNAIDLGSGIGIPGLYLAMNSNISVDYLDSNSRRTAYLKNFLLLNDVEGEVINKRYSNASDFTKYDLIISRGFKDHKLLVEDFNGSGSKTTVISTTTSSIPYLENQKIYRKNILGNIFYIAKTECFT